MRLKGGIAAGLHLGSLGFKVKGLTPAQVIEDAEYFSEILVRNKVLGFIGLNPTPEEHEAIMRALYRGDEAPSSLTPGTLRDVVHTEIWGVEDEPSEAFIARNWHLDNPFNERVPSYTSMYMHTFTCRNDVGQTHFVSLTDLFIDCPSHIKPLLADIKFLPATGAQSHNVNRDLVAHPALRTHPVTSETMLYWSGMDTEPASDFPLFHELKAWVVQQLANPARRYTWYWKQGDLLVWDNRSVLHSFSCGWERDERMFNRCEIGNEKPFYEPSRANSLSSDFGDVVRRSGIESDKSVGPNPDHIPLVFTKGIYALPHLSHLYQTITMFVYSEDGSLPDDVVKFNDAINNSRFSVIAVKPSDNDFLKRFRRLLPDDVPLLGRKFLFTQNGDLEKAYLPDDDLFTSEHDSEGRWPPVPLVQSLLEIHPDLRHAGHAWHYPCWFDHQPLQFRPWDFRNLPFLTYRDFNGQEPPHDFLVQFAVDTVYGCFNHLESNEDRKHMIEDIIDYLQYMLELNEHENDR